MKTYVVRTQTRDNRQFETTLKADGFYDSFDCVIFYRKGFLWWRHPMHIFKKRELISVAQTSKDRG